MKPYSYLRGKLNEFDIEQRYLAELLNRSLWYVVERLAGRSPWGQDDMYKLMEIIGEPDDMLHNYFPPKGNAAASRLRAVK